MNNRSITLLITGIMLLSVTFLSSCEKEDNITFEKYPVELIGSWDIISGIPEVVITTNSDQQTWDLTGQGNGSLIVTGEHEVELSYIYGEPESILILNNNIIDLFMNEEFPAYVFVYSPIDQSAVFQVILSEEEMEAYISDGTGIIFNPQTLGLTLNNQEFISVDGNTSVTISGSISVPKINIPANTPTAIPTWMGGGLVQGVFNFLDQGNFTSILEDEAVSGSWEVTEGDTLKLVLVDTLDTGTIAPDSLKFKYNLVLGILTLNLESEPVCAETAGYPRADCLASMETQYGLEPGSLIEITEGIQLVLTKSTGTKATRSVMNHRFLDSYNWRFGNNNLINKFIRD